MNSFLVYALGLLGFLAALWALVVMAKATGEAREARRQAEEKLKHERKAAEIVAEHRTDDDTIDRLSNGKF